MVVISPYTKKTFVSHQVRDSTAILKLIETRFNLPALTQRDAAQVGMDDPNTGFFDFVNAPWKVPPTNLPAQTVLDQSACFVNPPPTPQ
jgi:phospholipase C